MASPFKPFTIRPMTGPMDLRSSVDETPVGAFRYKRNLSINSDGKLARALGWVKPYDNPPCDYKNWDWHDQQVAIEDREPLTMLFPSTSNENVRRLFAATKTRLIELDESAGVWNQLPGSFGADGSPSLTQTRFHAAELQNQVVFTNNFDIPQIHVLGSGTVAPIADLANVDNELPINATGLTKARVVISWSGFMFLMNTVEGGVRIPNRIRWSHLNHPANWQVSPVGTIDGETSVADYADITGRILNAIALAGSLFVLTEDAIWRCQITVDLVGATVALNCVRVYHEPKTRSKCLAYPNTLVSDGIALWYAGQDGIYSFIPGQDIAPVRVEWLHRSTPIIFKQPDTLIDRRACESPVIEYHPAPTEAENAGEGELHISWPTYKPIAELVGGTCDEPQPPIAGDGINNHTLVANLKNLTADYREYGSTAMVNFRSDILAIGDCNQNVLFLSANGQDFCLKQLDTGYGRVMFDAATGLYTTVGYFSVLRGIFPFERYDTEKIIQSFLVESTPEIENDEAVLRLRIGTSDQAIDPNSVNGCSVLWRQLKNEGIACRYTRTPAQYQAANIRPHNPVSWAFLARGRFLYYELVLAAADNSAPTSGGCTFSRLEVEARLE